GIDSLIDELSDYLGTLAPEEVIALLPGNEAALARVFPVLAWLVSAAPGPKLVPTYDAADLLEVRRRAFEALRVLLRRIAERRPVVLHIDALQWGDLDSAALITDLLRAPHAPALLFIGTFRSEETKNPVLLALPQVGEPEVTVREISVEPLSAES